MKQYSFLQEELGDSTFARHNLNMRAVQAARSAAKLGGAIKKPSLNTTGIRLASVLTPVKKGINRAIGSQNKAVGNFTKNIGHGIAKSIGVTKNGGEPAKSLHPVEKLAARGINPLLKRVAGISYDHPSDTMRVSNKDRLVRYGTGISKITGVKLPTI